jgi:hypothetical protein
VAIEAREKLEKSLLTLMAETRELLTKLISDNGSNGQDKAFRK